MDNSETDHLQHVNNAVYLQYMERAAWAHTEALALAWQDYVRLDTALVVRHHDLAYLKAAYPGERLQVVTWIADNDQRLNIWRGFQIWRARDKQLVFKALSRYVVINLTTGRPCRMPQEFMRSYQPSPGP